MAYYREFKAPSLEEAEAQAHDFLATLDRMSSPGIERTGLIEHANGRQEHYVIVRWYTLD